MAKYIYPRLVSDCPFRHDSGAGRIAVGVFRAGYALWAIFRFEGPGFVTRAMKGFAHATS